MSLTTREMKIKPLLGFAITRKEKQMISFWLLEKKILLKLLVGMEISTFSVGIIMKAPQENKQRTAV